MKFRTISLAAFAACFCGSALAVDLTQPLTDVQGKIIHERSKDDKYDDASPVVTMGEAISMALQAPRGNRDDPGYPLAAAKRARLAVKVALGKEMDFSSDEISAIKGGMGAFPAIWTFRVLEAVDPASLKE